jgi:multiple sugar transport system permease protein
MAETSANVAATPTRRWRIKLSRQTRETITGYLFVSPWIFSLLVFTAYPMVASFYFSMTRYNILKPPQWIGFENFTTMVTTDPLYIPSVQNTAYYVILSVPLSLIFGLILALLLNQAIKGIGFFRTAFYLPGLVPAVAGTLLWMVLLSPKLGLVNNLLEIFGAPRLGWLVSVTWSKPALIIMALWGGTGASMLIFLAALKEIPQSLVEAAMMDGANSWQRFWVITIPMISTTIFFNLVMGIIASFQVFASAYVAAGTGNAAGPSNSLLMYMLLLYRNAFRYFNMGYASAMAVVMFIVLVAFTLALVRSSSTWVHYENANRS